MKRSDYVVEGDETQYAVDQPPEVVDEEWAGSPGEPLFESVLCKQRMQPAEYGECAQGRQVIERG